MSESDPFTMLGLAPRFDIEPARARSAWMRLAALAHPDASGGIDRSASINDAYRTVLDPLARAAALLRLRGAPAGDDRALPPGFLMELMDLRERVDACASDAEARGGIRAEVVQMREEAIASLAVVFASAGGAAVPMDEVAATEARTTMNVVRSYDRVLEQLDRESAGPGGGAQRGAAP